ncbi:hypothetical protein NN561_010992 [Cricetulus griseus]
MPKALGVGARVSRKMPKALGDGPGGSRGRCRRRSGTALAGRARPAGSWAGLPQPRLLEEPAVGVSRDGRREGLRVRVWISVPLQVGTGCGDPEFGRLRPPEQDLDARASDSVSIVCSARASDSVSTICSASASGTVSIVCSASASGTVSIVCSASASGHQV